MRKLFLISVFIHCINILFGQKPPIDSAVYDKWPSVEGADISNDGNYVLYIIENQPVGSRTLVIQATNADWKIEIPGTTSYSADYSQDNRRAVFTKREDSLGIVTLGGSSVEYIPHVSSFKLPRKGSGEWLAYQLNSPEKELVVRNLVTSKEKPFTAVKNYLFSDDGSVLLLQVDVKKDSTVTQALQWVSLAAGNMTTIWSTGLGGQDKKADNFVFDKSDTQLAFTVEDKINNQPENSFWYCKAGTGKALLLADDHSPGIDTGLRLDRISGFSKDGNRLFFTLKEKDYSKAKPDAVQVDVWSYTDAKLQSQQLNELAPKSYEAVIHIQDHRIIRLKQEDETLSLLPSVDDNTDDWGLIINSKGYLFEWNWNPACRQSVYLISTKDGERKRIKELEDHNHLGNMSPEGKYVIYYDPKQKSFFSYEIASGITRNITQGIAVTWKGYNWDDEPSSSNYARGVAGWMKGDAAVLIYDRNDIWQVDLAGEKPPVNLTNGYGRRHNIVFDLGLADYSRNRKAIANNEKLILSAFNRANKDNGFYSKVQGKTGDPELLTMGPYLYDITGNPYIPDGSNFPPVKAMNAETYIVRRMSATEAPNYFSTTDFKTFIRLSDLHPETAYNWLRSELVTWKTLDGSASQGVLYKPENFNPKKKYPVIFYYYDIRSDGLNAYLKPEASDCDLNIPSFVSNGYLVFTPDIHFKIGETGESVVNSVVSAANYLSKMPWVDARKMGIQGCSLGGYETYYLVTHTNLFAAACSASGLSDFVSGYGSLSEGYSLQFMYENFQNRIGATLWQRPDLYIKNSPVFKADKVTTPLLMMHTKNDGICPFANVIELFTALRRLGKKAWMLQYDDGNHGVWGKSATDFSIRLAQFFDHYLKGAPAPKWMVQGIPAKMKGIETGLELDGSGKEP
ncbi:MAG TPA: prolyl oligopeptidase family serine peptidase [Puia sp.]